METLGTPQDYFFDDPEKGEVETNNDFAPFSSDMLDDESANADEQPSLDSLALGLAIVDGPSLAELQISELNDENEVAEEEAAAEALNLDIAESELSLDSLELYMRSIGRVKLLTAAQEIELAKRIGRGDREARRQMIEANLRLVAKFAKPYRNRGVPYQDLMQEATIGLFRAVDKYDWRRGYKFSTYATWWIRQAAQRAIANQGNTVRIPVHVYERILKLDRFETEFMKLNGREPDKTEVTEGLKLNLEHVGEAYKARGLFIGMVSLNSPIGDQEDAELGMIIVDDSAEDPEEGAIRNITKDELHQAVERLEGRKRLLIELRFGLRGNSPQTLEVIGRELGITRERVRQLEAHAIDDLEDILKGKLSSSWRQAATNGRRDYPTRET